MHEGSLQLRAHLDWFWADPNEGFGHPRAAGLSADSDGRLPEQPASFRSWRHGGRLPDRARQWGNQGRLHAGECYSWRPLDRRGDLPRSPATPTGLPLIAAQAYTPRLAKQWGPCWGRGLRAPPQLPETTRRVSKSSPPKPRDVLRELRSGTLLARRLGPNR